MQTILWAWRLARENDGDVWFDAAAGGPTRFVLALPHESASRESPAEAAVNNGSTTNGWNTPDTGIPRTDPLSRLSEIEPVSPADS